MKRTGPSDGVSASAASARRARSPERPNRTSFASTFDRLIDGLPEQMALLDENWIILSVNEPWANTISALGYDLMPGSDYRAFCIGRAEEGYRAASLSRAAIEKIDRGGSDFESFSYSGQGTMEGRDFEIQIHRLEIAGRRFNTVARHEVTELNLLRRLRDDFSGALVKSQEIERRRMARELHDSTMQLLVAAGLAIGELKRSGIPNGAVSIVAEIEALLIDATRELRSIAYLAHGPTLDRDRFGDAIASLVDGFARRVGVKSALQGTESLPQLGQASQVALYRVFQEALSNIHRHSGATELAIRFAHRRSLVHAVIADNGRGIPDGSSKGVGLRSMEGRLREIGGRLSIVHSAPGTAIIATVPIRPDPEA